MAAYNGPFKSPDKQRPPRPSSSTLSPSKLAGSFMRLFLNKSPEKVKVDEPEPNPDEYMDYMKDMVASYMNIAHKNSRQRCVSHTDGIAASVAAKRSNDLIAFLKKKSLISSSLASSVRRRVGLNSRN